MSASGSHYLTGDLLVGVDVGTGSARAALVDATGRVLKVAERKTTTWNPASDFYEQSSDDVWKAVCCCVQDVAESVANRVKGIGFDATCSLVVLDENFKPVAVNPEGSDERNIILWMDHRALSEAEEINVTNHQVLRFVGQVISPEMETPKLLWLKRNAPDTWRRAAHFFDLPDFLTWRATGSLSRSLCSTVCKWTYQAGGNQEGWNDSYFSAIGLGELNSAGERWRKIGTQIQAPGESCARGLTKQAALDLGLVEGIACATSLIDAHAGGLGMIGCRLEKTDSAKAHLNNRLGIIAGTSTCHMAISKDPQFVPGVWGPYWSAMIPGWWLNEGGQSATGKLIDHIIDTHPATTAIRQKLDKNMRLEDYLLQVLGRLAQQQKVQVAELTRDLHIWPDFHGNRSPLADHTLKGMISGLTLASDEKSLALLYLATIQAISYGTRHIIEELRLHGYSKIDTIVACGGLTKNTLYVQTQADAAQLNVLIPREKESVLVGAAMLGAVAAGLQASVAEAASTMSGFADVVFPQSHLAEYHENKYTVFKKMLSDQREYKSLMT